MEIKEQCGIIIRNNNKKWNLKCYRCQKRGYIAVKCRTMCSIMKNEYQNANITMHEKNAYYVFIGDVVMFIGVNNNDTNNNNPTINSGKWILDNGCMAHLCNNKNDFTNMCEICENLISISNASTNMKGKRRY